MLIHYQSRLDSVKNAGSATTSLTLLIGGLAVLAGRRRSMVRGASA